MRREMQDRETEYWLSSTELILKDRTFIDGLPNRMTVSEFCEELTMAIKFRYVAEKMGNDIIPDHWVSEGDYEDRFQEREDPEADR